MVIFLCYYNIKGKRKKEKRPKGYRRNSSDLYLEELSDEEDYRRSTHSNGQDRSQLHPDLHPNANGGQARPRPVQNPQAYKASSQSFSHGSLTPVSSVSNAHTKETRTKTRADFQRNDVHPRVVEKPLPSPGHPSHFAAAPQNMHPPNMHPQRHPQQRMH